MTIPATSRRPNLILLVVGGFIFFFIGKLIWWWINSPTTKNAVSPESVETTKETTTPALGEIGKLWETFDWNSTTPGKALAGLVGPEWVNWIIWGVIVALIVTIILELITKKAGPGTSTISTGSILKSIIGWALFAGALWWGFQNLSTWKDNRSVGSLDAKFVFNQGPDVKEEYVDREGKMELWYPAPGYHCGRIIGPAIMVDHPRRPQGENFVARSAPGGWWYFTFTPELKQFLKDYDVREPIKVEFEVSRTPITCH